MIDKKDMKKESTHQANREGDHILEELAEINADAIVLEPQSTFNRAIVGSDTDSRLVYSVTKIISALVDEDGMDSNSATLVPTQQEALEWFEFNTLGTFSGMDNINKPIFIYDEFIF